MKFDTIRFGEIEIENEDIIVFSEGIPGFEDERQFALIPYDEHSPFVFLQSVSNVELAFLVVSPFHFFADYYFEIDRSSMDELEITDKDDVVSYMILTVPAGDIKQVTANLLAPLIINQKNRQAKQIVLDKSQYTTKHRIFADQEGAATKGGK